nr:hypothetical protein Iba_chr02aCG8190 [Ipomoea batatas]
MGSNTKCINLMTLFIQSIQSFLIKVIARCNAHLSKTRHSKLFFNSTKEFPGFTRLICKITRIQSNTYSFIPQIIKCKSNSTKIRNATSNNLISVHKGQKTARKCQCI